MGNFFSDLRFRLFGDKVFRVLMIGLDNSGKTTSLYQLKLGDVVTTIPTIGFNVETINYKNLTFNVFDIGGQDKIRQLWKHYYRNNQGIIFVVDSSDIGRMSGGEGTVEYEIKKIVNEPELANVPILVYANKQDLSTSASIGEIAKRVGLDKVTDRPWYIQGTNAKMGEGLYEGLDWLSSVVVKNAKKI